MSTNRKVTTAQEIVADRVRNNGTLSWYLHNSVYPKREGNAFYAYFSGKDIFQAIATSIKEARYTIDIICWGFDPAMPLIRESGSWVEINTYGHLLKEAAKRGVKVKLLLWYYPVANAQMKNAIGRFAVKGVVSLPRPNPRARVYPEVWYQDIKKSPYAENIEIRSRAISNTLLLKGEDARLAGESTVYNFPSDHQKTVMVDYGRSNTHGYLMGHNSLTDYWDTEDMAHVEPLREMGLKPFHDFSLRVKGPCQIDLNANFCQAWDDNNPEPVSVATGPLIGGGGPKPNPRRQADLWPLRKRLDKNIIKVGDSAGQVVRTRTDKKINGQPEKEIKRAYLQLAQKPRQYILMVNQYVQYPLWARHLKKHVQIAKSKGYIKDLYLFIITCAPEDKGMLFRAQEIANEFGVSDQFPTLEKQSYNKEQNYAVKRLDVKAKQTKAALAGMGIHTVFCQLKTQVAGPVPKEIYIHAKLTVVDDIFFTLGSANLNTRSMAVDSEINLLSDDLNLAYRWRKTLFERYTGGRLVQPGPQANPAAFFKKFSEHVLKNQSLVKEKKRIIGFAVQFEDDRGYPSASRG